VSDARFIYEIPLATRGSQLDEVRARLDVARRVYNALVSEALRRVDLLRESRDFRRLRGLFVRTVKRSALTGAEKKAAWAPYNEARTAIRARFDLRGSYSLGKFGTGVAQKIPLWATGHGIGAQVVHALSARVWVAIEKYLDALDRGKAGKFARPRFRRIGETRSVEGMGSTPALRLSDDGDHVIWAAGKNGGQLVLPARWPRRLDAHDQHARGLILGGQVATTRLVMRTIRRVRRAYAQVTLKGEAYREPELEPRAGVTIGADLGFREVAYVTPNRAGIVPLSEDAARIDRELAAKRRRAQRALDRSRRATNASNYEANGTIKPRAQRTRWVRSEQYRAIQSELAEDQRRVAGIRKTETGRVLNTILPLGYELRIEDLSYKAWQQGRATAIARATKPGKQSPFAMRQGGSTSRVFAPGEFVARARVKWAHYGGSVTEIAATQARLSQLCHACGKYTTQATLGLSVFRRVHECACGVEPVQADLYQAFLARYASSEGNVDLPRARSSWAGAVTLLAAAGSTYETRKQDGSRVTSRSAGQLAGASERVAAESAPPRSQDPARRSGTRPRGAGGETDRASTIEPISIERPGDGTGERRCSKPVEQGKTSQIKRLRKGRT
jgi:hypothetical protein